LGPAWAELRLRAVAQAVEGDPEHVLVLGWVAGGDLGDPHDDLEDLGDADVRAHDARLLGAREQWFAGLEQ
jgi:hypothetical protein